MAMRLVGLALLFSTSAALAFDSTNDKCSHARHTRCLGSGHFPERPAAHSQLTCPDPKSGRR